MGLGEVVAVALGTVDQVHAKSPSPSQQLIDLVLGEALAPTRRQAARCQPPMTDPGSRA
jgi:hypothetical protein